LAEFPKFSGSVFCLFVCFHFHFHITLFFVLFPLIWLSALIGTEFWRYDWTCRSRQVNCCESHLRCSCTSPSTSISIHSSHSHALVLLEFGVIYHLIRLIYF
jgi:hypothetical protein